MRPSPRMCRMRQTRRASSASFFSSPSGSGPAGPFRMPHFLRYVSSHFAFAVAKRGPSLVRASASSAGCASSAAPDSPKKISRGGRTVSRLLPEHAEVKLTSVDVLLDERVALETVVQEARSLEHLVLGLRERRERDAVARLLADGLDERRDTRIASSRRSGRSRRETTKRATRIRWNASSFFASALSLQSISASGPGARVGHLHQLEQRGDVGLVRAVREEGLAQVEDDVGLERRRRDRRRPSRRRTRPASRRRARACAGTRARRLRSAWPLRCAATAR